MPCIHATALFDSSSSWVGIGGYNGGNVVQAGSVQEQWTDINGNPVYIYAAFIENAPQYGETQVFGVGCNDYMYASVSSPNNMFVQDVTTGNYWNGTQGGPYGDNSIEFITEKDNSHWPLADFNSETFKDCWGEELYNNWETVDLLNPWVYIAQNSSGQQLMNVGSLVTDSSGSRFTNTWRQGS